MQTIDRASGRRLPWNVPVDQAPAANRQSLREASYWSRYPRALSLNSLPSASTILFRRPTGWPVLD
jgi:hypothetical protein